MSALCFKFALRKDLESEVLATPKTLEGSLNGFRTSLSAWQRLCGFLSMTRLLGYSKLKLHGLTLIEQFSQNQSKMAKTMPYLIDNPHAPIV